MLDHRTYPAMEPDAALLAAAVEASDVCVTIADLTTPDGPLIFVNRAFNEMTGYERCDVVGRNCRFLQGPDTDPEAVAAMGAAIKSGRSLRLELINYKKCGEPFWNSLHLSPLHGPDGAVRAYVGMQSDVTKVRAAAAAEQHRQRIEALGRMAGGVAHEINNLLQPLVSLPELVAESLPAEAVGAREDLRVIGQSARDARDLVSEVLTYTRVAHTGSRPLEIEAALSGVLELVRRGLSGRVEVVQQGKAPEGARIAGLSRAGLQQALTNLILNAADAMGGSGCVTVRLGGDEASVTLAVLDQGPGVDPDAAARMFEPFFTTKAPGAGAGLGLYIVHQLVERAGGVVTLCAAPGGGACFEMQFPRDRSGADQE
jgi:PAS domain S-box-containing protein